MSERERRNAIDGAANRLIAEHGDGWMDALEPRVRAYVDRVVTGERAQVGRMIAI